MIKIDEIEKSLSEIDVQVVRPGAGDPEDSEHQLRSHQVLLLTRCGGDIVSEAHQARLIEILGIILGDDLQFSISLGLLAEEYGVPLDPYLERYAEDTVIIYRDDDGWHVNGGELQLTDDWAPRSNTTAVELWAAAANE